MGTCSAWATRRAPWSHTAVEKSRLELRICEYAVRSMASPISTTIDSKRWVRTETVIGSIIAGLRRKRSSWRMTRCAQRSAEPNRCQEGRGRCPRECERIRGQDGPRRRRDPALLGTPRVSTVEAIPAGLLETRGLTKRFGGLVAVNGLGLAIGDGEV